MNRRGGGLGFWPALTGALIGAAGLYGYMQWQEKDRLVLDWGHAEDYIEFLEDEGDIDPAEPFKAEPLTVKASAEVRDVPDIAVITASMSAKDTLESRAVDDVATRVNAVQAAIAKFDVDVSVTDAKTTRKYDPICHSENQEARQRHVQINSDHWFNKRLDQKGDTKTKRRDPKPRIAQKICSAQSIEARTALVIRVSPPDAAGNVLQALADAGADSSQLYGYDFSNYDALYQEAAAKAVSKARAKAEMIARHAKADLGEIVEFYVGRPARTGRFGPQPTIINKSSARSNRGPSYSVGFAPPPPAIVREAPSVQYWDGSSVDEIIVTASKRVVSKSGHDGDKQYDLDDEGEEDVVPTSQNNALQMSLLSGPKSIRVSASLSYDYKTVIDGSVVPQEDNYRSP
ncbi:MAG: SIMPL domain-containing protein [Maricaulaceae bacterium]